jgi:hypothetical protein
MIRPCSFGMNEQTAVDNLYQHSTEKVSQETLQAKALAEFTEMASLLQAHGVNVCILEDTPWPRKPDSIFPNNWFSTHVNSSSKTLVLYPMAAPNRREEVRSSLAHELIAMGFVLDEVVDFRHAQGEQYLEGTGSLVLDHLHRKAYASLSRRTDAGLVHAWCKRMGYLPVIFEAYQEEGDGTSRVYHTNVVMSIGTHWAVICAEAMDPAGHVVEQLQASGREIITITRGQMAHFCGNVLEVVGRDHAPLLVCSETAWSSFTTEQRRQLKRHAEELVVRIPTIERFGGGSARCMMAEIFLEREQKG